MEGKRFIQKIKLQNLLSYGPEGEEIELQPLNVLIGPNASGKSNLIEAISLLRAIPTDLTIPIRKGGGIEEWLWKGEDIKQDEIPVAQLEIIAEYYQNLRKSNLRYSLGFSVVAQRLHIEYELLRSAQSLHEKQDDLPFYYYERSDPELLTRTIAENGKSFRHLRTISRRELNLEQSILSQRKDPDLYPEITYLSNGLSKIKLYQEWNFGRSSPSRQPQLTDLPNDFLLEDASNLSLILNDLRNQRKVWRSVLEKLRKFNERIDEVTPNIKGGTVQLFAHEDGLERPVPATRLSDGTLRWLCLLAILCHPEPPPLICIEEPEIGLHPDILPTLADLLIEASQRTQLIVTTHSDVLISALSSVPEAVIVCERDEKGTHLRRLDPEQLKDWLEKYSLGDLWLRGQLGGTRW